MIDDWTQFPEPMSRTPGTEQKYIKHARSLRSAYRAETGQAGTLPQVVQWFVTRDELYAASTVRSYRAALNLMLVVYEEASKISTEDFYRCRALLTSGPVPKAKRVNPKTSSLKSRSVPDHKLAKLLRFLDRKPDADSRFLAKWVRWSLTFFPRPSEWRTAQIIDRECDGGGTNPAIRFGNSKTTNGRSFGAERYLDLHLDANQLSDLQDFLGELHERIGLYKNPAAFYDNFRKQLPAACAKIKVPKLALYSLRHIGMAVAKSVMDSQAVSYAAGHGSDVTKTVHYARRRDMGDGWLSPDQAFSVRAEDKNLVRVTGKVRRFEPKSNSQPTMRP